MVMILIDTVYTKYFESAKDTIKYSSD